MKSDTGFECKCNDGFTGTFCQDTSNYCLNGGSLVVANKLLKSLLTNPLYKCECKDGFYGLRCELSNPCEESPCANNGKCIALSSNNNNSFVCQCPADFSGQLCTIYKNENCLDQDIICPQLSTMCYAEIIKKYCPQTCNSIGINCL
jgi:hypothetical protein